MIANSKCLCNLSFGSDHLLCLIDIVHILEGAGRTEIHKTATNYCCMRSNGSKVHVSFSSYCLVPVLIKGSCGNAKPLRFHISW